VHPQPSHREAPPGPRTVAPGGSCLQKHDGTEAVPVLLDELRPSGGPVLSQRVAV
jgi:hypothetical protein